LAALIFSAKAIVAQTFTDQDVSALAKGIYVLELNTEKGNYVNRIIVE